MTATTEITNFTGFQGIYEVPEAARYIKFDIRIPDRRYNIHSSHIIRWIRKGLADPELVHIHGRQMVLSFEDLVSMRVIAFLRALGYSFHKIKIAERNLRNLVGHSHPFATESVWAENQGALDIFADMGNELMTATRGGQFAFVELVREHLINMHGMTFNQRHIADSWSPKPGILMHPRIQFGRPCILGTRIPTSELLGMVDAGDNVVFLARSYGVEIIQIETAITWEREIRKLAAA